MFIRSAFGFRKLQLSRFSNSGSLDIGVDAPGFVLGEIQ
jgi:hypothetical protein